MPTAPAPAGETTAASNASLASRIDALFPWVIAIGILVADQITKQVALASLEAGRLVPVVGSYLSFTYVRNPGIAFGLHLGAFSRPFFVLTALGVLAALIAFYRSTPREDRLRRLAIAVLCAGAIGNLIDRIRWSEGVVDFIRLAVGGYEWPIFNIADMAVTTGAILLGISLLTEGRKPRPF
ncbi:MAG TPA: signal peptidase II [Longimicrobiales bacterium]|nr:signal peptidase II [Longimicrobiales bacterium]